MIHYEEDITLTPDPLRGSSHNVLLEFESHVNHNQTILTGTYFCWNLGEKEMTGDEK